MVMRARVELTGSLTHNGNGRKFVKGQPQILTNPSDIKYYKEQACFSVTVLATKKTKVEAEITEDPSQDVGNDGDAGEDDDDNEAYTEEELEEHKKADLKEIAAELGLDVGGTKKELIERILANQQ